MLVNCSSPNFHEAVVVMIIW